MAMLCTLTAADRQPAAPIEVLEVFPSGAGLRLLICRGGVRSRIAVRDLPRALCDAATGELIANPPECLRLQWACRVCAAHGGWPLHHWIAGLLVEGFGTTTAADLALALGTWERFEKAIDPLCEAAVPSSREEFVLAHDARGRSAGVFEATPDALDHALDLCPGPLSNLLDACGPRAWRGLRSWGLSPRRALDVASLLGLGRPLPFGRTDHEAFLRERFASPPTESAASPATRDEDAATGREDR